MKLLSVIVPCYNEQENIRDFYNELMKSETFFKEQGTDIELIYINDGSVDKTIDEVKKLNDKDKRVKLVSFSRNFGKEAAIYAGLEKAAGDYVVIMDCDLQDPPALLPDMYKAVVEEGYDSVATRRVDRKGEPPIRSFFARMFYKLINRMSKTEIVDGARDYRLMTRQFVDAVLSVKEYNRFSKGIFGWVGFKNKWIEFENVERRKGETKWSFWKLFMYAIDGIMAFSTVPLSFAAFTGLFFCILSFLFILFTIVRKLIFQYSSIDGWSSLVCIILLISGIQLFCIGIVGQYLSKTYTEVKKRPLYIVKEEI
ncbi:MAG: glycosyltransferase family 2 protein [Butyrivibrio sp.]|nr:glycosyltransferase family 2 protein [Butyrivibrio sp.]